ncbi:MAG: hypothetical protein AAFS10_03030 [Myxococcota bacterium]
MTTLNTRTAHQAKKGSSTHPAYPFVLGLVGAALLLSLTACSDNSGSESGNTSNATTGTTNATTGNTSTCSPGETGCPCDTEGSCSQEGVVCRDDMCLPCVDGEEGCDCFGNGTCNAGLRCEEESCAVCPPGEETCACDAGGLCGDGLICMEELCVPEDCTNSPGRDGCPCDEGQTCDEDLVCTDGGMCAACSSDMVDCPCDEEGECGNELVCDEDEERCREPVACEELACVPNQQCEEGESGVDASCLEACLPGFEWNIVTGMCDAVITANCDMGAEGSIRTECSNQNRACTATDEGATCGVCLEGFTDEEGALMVCRAVRTCAELGCTGQNRSCVDATATTDAACNACLEGFVEDNDGVCVVPVVANCDPGAPGSILAECQAANRTCGSDGNGGVACGDCSNGFAEDTQGACSPTTFCADLECAAQGRTCAGEPFATCGDCAGEAVPVDPNDIEQGCRDLLTCAQLQASENACDGDNGEFCTQAEGEDASCTGWPCLNINGEPDLTQAFNPILRQCVDCEVTCTNTTGATGNRWPFTDRAGRCICETQEGFYYDTSGLLAPRRCDADGDGWIRRSAEIFINSDDEALSTNARCDLREIDRFVLRNEYRQERAILLCVEGEVIGDACQTDDDCAPGGCFGANGACGADEAGCTCQCREAQPVKLYESVRNDDPEDLNRDDDAPAYQGGRKFQNQELNGLTRACVTENADFNDNGIADTDEWQLSQASVTTTEEDIFLKFAYFVELHRAWYERDIGIDYGRYIIEERSRCEPDFPLTYNDAIDGEYWRSCTRNRDTRYSATSGASQAGMDFAQWSCDQTEDTCPLPDPILGAVSSVDGIPVRGLCDDSLVLPPEDGVWRGMNHHSQFKCAVIDAEEPDNPEDNPSVVVLDELTNSGGDQGLQYNTCILGDPQAHDDSIDPTNPASPQITCTPASREAPEVNVDSVGFVSVRTNTLAYTRGCINEWNNWPDLCPGYNTNPEAVAGAGHESDFGRLLCGCTFNFGGVNCDAGCSGDQLHVGGSRADNEGTCANGYCAVTAADVGRSGYWMCGDVQSSAFVGDGMPPMFLSEDGSYEVHGSISATGLGHTALCESATCDTGWSVH